MESVVTIATITKRNGAQVDFDPQKITSAIIKAGRLLKT